MTTPHELWYRLKAGDFNSALGDFELSFNANVSVGSFADPFSMSLAETAQLIFLRSSLGIVRLRPTPKTTALQNSFHSFELDRISGLESSLKSTLQAYGVVSEAVHEVDTILSELIRTEGIDKRPRLEALQILLRRKFAIASYLRCRVDLLWPHLDALMAAAVDLFPRSPITGTLITEHFYPAVFVKNQYMFSGDSTYLDEFTTSLRTLLEDDKLTEIFHRENGGAQQLPGYRTALYKKLDQFEVALILPEVMA